MTTFRSLFSFEQFEEVLQKLAHKTAIHAVTNKLNEVRITIHGNKFNTVDSGNVEYRFYATHASYNEKGSRYADWWGFDVEKKLYMTSSHKTKISFYAPEGEKEKRKAKIVNFIDKIMAEASMKPEPRFKLSQVQT